MAIAFIGMVASIIGSFFVKGGVSTDSHSLSRALHMGTNVAMVLTAIGVVGASLWLFSGDEFENPLGLAISVIGRPDRRHGRSASAPSTTRPTGSARSRRSPGSPRPARPRR